MSVSKKHPDRGRPVRIRVWVRIHINLTIILSSGAVAGAAAAVINALTHPH